jgi:hypothetical protein
MRNGTMYVEAPQGVSRAIVTGKVIVTFRYCEKRGNKLKKIVTILIIGAALYVTACAQKEKESTLTSSDNGVLMETHVPKTLPNVSVLPNASALINERASKIDENDVWTPGAS